MPRCHWAELEPNRSYHDLEWGVPLHDDRLLFEFLTLEGAQAGLSWTTILKKRETYRRAFANFDPEVVARFDELDLERLLADPGIVRNRQKLVATIQNARSVLAVQTEFGGFDRYIWGFVGGQPTLGRRENGDQPPVKTPESEAMNRDLLRHGFKFVGPTICYAFMQATGMVNDHQPDCFRYRELTDLLALSAPVNP